MQRDGRRLDGAASAMLFLDFTRLQCCAMRRSPLSSDEGDVTLARAGGVAVRLDACAPYLVRAAS
jgi:hypothetical protein